MSNTHTNTPVLTKRVIALVLAASMCVNTIGQATAITYDSATSTYFDSVDDYGLTGSSESVGLQFGGTLGEFLRFNRLLDKFILTDDLDVQGTISGHALKIMGTAAISGTLVLEGSATLSGGALRGFGLSADCDTGATSKLLWDATTGRFSCGTDQTGGSTGGGISQTDADLRYVNTHGDTMTGKLLLQNTSIQASSGTFLGLDSNDDVVLTVKGGSMNTTDLQQWKDSSDTLLVNVAADGNITAGNATFNGNVNVTGSNIALGDANTDNVGITGDVNTDINPEYGGMQGLGNSSNRWNGWFYNVNTSSNLDVGNNISTSNLSATSYSNLTYLNVSNAVNLANYTNGGSGCSALETDGMGNLTCGTDDGGSGMSSFNISDGMNTETINDGNNITFSAGDSNISVNVSMTDTVTIGFTNAAGFLTSESDPTYYSNPYGYINSSSDNIGYDTYFNITDGSTTELINTWDNVTFSDGLNMNVTVSATDTVTIGTADNVSFTNLNVSDGSTFGDNISDTMNISAGNWTFANETIFTMNGGPLRVRGVLSGVTLYATRSFSGAGLTDCDTGATSKLLWDATTGRFSCGTDQSGGTSGTPYTAGQGLSLNGANAFSLNTTITGSLVEFTTVSGATIFAQRTLATSGTLLIENLTSDTNEMIIADSASSEASQVFMANVNGHDKDADGLYLGMAGNSGFMINRENEGLAFGTNNVGVMDITSAGNVAIGKGSVYKFGSQPTTRTKFEVLGAISGSFLYATKSFSGAGLSDCDNATTSKLLWDATTGRFSCGTDQTGGGSSGGGLDYATASGIFLKRSGGTMTGTLTIDRGTLGQSDSGTGLIVRERASFLSGATLSGQLLIKTNGDPGTPPAGNLYLYAKDIADRSLLKAKGPSGIDYALQPSLFQNQVAMWLPATSTTAGHIFGWTFTSAGTVSHPALASTNMLTQMRRARWASTTTANGVGGIFNAQTVAWRGNAAGLGGFFFYARFGQAVNTNGARSFVGLSARTTHAVSAEPNANVDMVGMGYNSTDSSAGNWILMHNDSSGTATQIDLGSNAARDTTSVFDLFLFAPPNGSTIGVRINNVSTGVNVYDGTLSSDLPTSTTFLRVHAGNGPAATATQQQFELNRLYLESDT